MGRKFSLGRRLGWNKNIFTSWIYCHRVNTFIGVLVGAIWGFSKAIDKVMLEIYNIISSVPYILIVTVLLYAFGRGFWQLVLAMCLTGWLGTAYFYSNTSNDYSRS